VSTDVTMQNYAKEINKSWRKTTDSVLETARLCAEADKALRADEKSKLIKGLDFSKATFSKLVKIGSKPQLQSDPIKASLPPSYSIVYEVAKLKEPDLQVAIKEGVINPGMTRGELSAWVSKRGPKAATTDDQNRPKVIATVQVPPDYDVTKQQQLEKALDKLRAQFGFSLERPRDPETTALNRMAERMNDYIRREARRYINTVKTRRFQDAGKVSAAEKKKLWSFAEDETAIPVDASWEQVEAALDIIGNGDQFPRIRDEALRLYGVPEDVVSTHPLDDPEEVMKEFRAARETVRKMHEKKYADIKFVD
jgi:tellurite resistance protein